MNNYLTLFVSQPLASADKSDDELDFEIPDEFWIEHPACIYILTVKVHRHNTCFTKECADVAVSPPPTRAEIRDKAEERKRKKREEDAVEREQAVQVRAAIQERSIRLQEKRAKTERAMARENILSSRKKRETATVTNKQTQMKLLRKNRKVYVSLYGQEAYDNKMGELLTACLAADNVNDDNTNLENSEDEGEDGGEENVPEEDGQE